MCSSTGSLVKQGQSDGQQGLQSSEHISKQSCLLHGWTKEREMFLLVPRRGGLECNRDMGNKTSHG